MRITGLGHAGLRIDTAAGSVLVDPWTTPAYLGAWTPFPDNAGLDWARLADTDHLVVTSVAPDHLDLELLRRHVRRDVSVLLPDLPTTELRDRLAGAGFTRFVETRAGVVTDLGGLRVGIDAQTRPTDGPSGQAVVWLSDGTATVLVQGEAQPRDLRLFTALGPVDVHLLQATPAGWSPMAYDLPEQARRAIADDLRAHAFRTARRYVSEVGAAYVVPIGGPPAFRDDGLAHLNRLGEDGGSTHLDPTEFRDWMAERGYDNVRLLLPGSTADPREAGMPVTHALPAGEAVYADKAALLRGTDRAPWDAPPARDLDVLAELRAWWEPLLTSFPAVADGVGTAVRLTGADAGRGDVDVLLDFRGRSVRAYDGEKVRYELRVDRALLEHLVAVRETDWVHSLFLSGRFTARRIGRENELVFLFLGSLDPVRLGRLESWLTHRHSGGDDVTIDGWTVQRLCPHQQADLTEVGSVEDGVLTCGVHGWRWRLADGACLTVRGMDLRSAPAPTSG
ncbi:Rieske 2Fe-2S domain-containing protein [Trujillonella endophytica]|uniref:UDP-MurNAc hydroxylase n=1 Tax=Trujillonella endophytica TaxID=673521 RepID=A0A1H8VW90_9ACTN|nr:Rieske 2Fe-2S domain-containing protein [Trujillella endophytica]SEP19669.1 UDP-MurNAc hydroxylase [Trujillella endophytica]